ncbi:MAG: tetratricopeptide repeat protein [Acidobacteriota bacterium]|nr:tetratricopeptide repeat protein [Blastocatellia bacterium]MDW8413818.1 tetratricopeptide repeat protein [Acidobacteriota bacterium]
MLVLLFLFFLQSDKLAEAIRALSEGRAVEAEQLLRPVAENRPSAEVYDLLGIACDQQGKLVEAEKLFLKALKLRPAYLNARNNLGNNLLRQGRVQEALRQFEAVVRMRPNHPEANYNLSLLYLQLGQRRKAQQHFRRLGEAADLQVLFLGLEIALATGDGIDSSLERIYRLDDRDGKVHFTAGLALARRGHYDRAVEAFKYTLERQKDVFEVHYNLGLALYNLGKLEEAEAAFTTAAQLKPELAEVHYRLGLVLSALGDTEAAIEEFTHAVEREQKADYYFLLGDEYYKRNSLKAALENYEKAIALDSSKAAYHLKLGHVCFKLFKYSRAEEAYRRVAELADPSKVEVNYLIGYALRSQGKLAESIGYFEKQLELSGKHFESLANLGYIKVELGEYEQAQKYLEEALKVRRSPEVLYDLGRMYLKRREFAVAIDYLNQALTLKPDYTQARYQLFLAYSRAGRKDEAERELAIFKKLEEEDKRERDERERLQREGE